MLDDYNKYSMDDEHGLKERGKKNFLIKQRVEAAEGINYSHRVKELKQQIRTLQQHNQELEK